MLVVDRRGRAGEIVDLVDLDVERERDIVAHQLEARMGQQMLDVVLAAGEEVVDADDVVAFRNQAIAKVRTEEPGAAGDENRLAIMHVGILPIAAADQSKQETSRDSAHITSIGPTRRP